MRLVVHSVAGLLLSACLSGQTKPVQIKGQCSAEIVQEQTLACSTEEPCPLFLELAGSEIVSTRIVLVGNLHTESQTLESVLLVSDDGGRSWMESHKRIPGAVLDEIQFLDFETGWINGHILQTTPKDAFFLLTTDGGKTWHRRPVSSESRTGAVDQFWFDSRQHGLATIDRVRAAEGFRYELWESQTGGESWSVRQVDAQPIAFTKPPRESVLRIRTDAKAQVHRLERRDGAKWVSVAAFQIAAGECKPPAPEFKEAPPEITETPPSPTPDTSGRPASPPPPRKPPSLRKNP